MEPSRCDDSFVHPLHMLDFGIREKKMSLLCGQNLDIWSLFFYSERDELMLRNEELSQELQTVIKTLEDEKLALEKDINGRMEIENIQRQKYDQLQESCDKLKEEVHFIQYNFIIPQTV